MIRYGSLLDAPDEAIHCWAWGHPWEPDLPSTRPGFGGTVDIVRAPCRSCGRVRTDTRAPRTYELLSRSYVGGHGLLAREIVLRHEAQAEWARRARARAAGVQTLAQRRRKPA